MKKFPRNGFVKYKSHEEFSYSISELRKVKRDLDKPMDAIIAFVRWFKRRGLVSRPEAAPAMWRIVEKLENYKTAEDYMDHTDYCQRQTI